MSVTYTVVGAVALIFVIFVVYNYKKMNNLQNTPNHEKIKTLNNGNFTPNIKSGTVLVDFWAPWCGPCKMMAPILNDIADTDSGKVTIAKVNVDNQQLLARKFKIKSIPTLVMFKNGKEVKRYTGVKTKKFLLNEINNLELMPN